MSKGRKKGSKNTVKNASKINRNNEIKRCCICSSEYVGYGNNAKPIKEGRCCNECNSFKVVPARIDILMNSLNINNQMLKKKLYIKKRWLRHLIKVTNKITSTKYVKKYER